MCQKWPILLHKCKFVLLELHLFILNNLQVQITLRSTVQCGVSKVHWNLMNYFALDAELMCLQPAVTLRGNT